MVAPRQVPEVKDHRVYRPGRGALVYMNVALQQLSQAADNQKRYTVLVADFWNRPGDPPIAAFIIKGI